MPIHFNSAEVSAVSQQDSGVRCIKLKELREFMYDLIEGKAETLLKTWITGFKKMS